jgi:hypothetical protein
MSWNTVEQLAIDRAGEHPGRLWERLFGSCFCATVQAAMWHPADQSMDAHDAK